MRRLAFAIAAGVLLSASTSVWAQDAQERASFKQQLENWLPGMSAEKIPDRRESQQALQEALLKLGAPGREAELAAACKAIAERLGRETAKPARVWMLRQLEFNGGAECVATVAVLLRDEDPQIRDSARRALQSNPAPEANAKLLEGLADAVDDVQRVAIVNALGCRADPSSTKTVAKLLATTSQDADDQALAAAAAHALGKIGGPQAAAALNTALSDAAEPLKAGIADACLRCADQLLQSGKRGEAMGVYQRLNKSPDSPRSIRLAALQGVLSAAGDDAPGRVLALLDSGDVDERAIAAGHVGSLLTADAVQAFTTGFPKLQPEGQSLFIYALAVKADKAAMPIAMAAVSSSREDLRLAGIHALGKLGDASAVPSLVEAMAAGGAESDAAHESLREIFGAGVDEAIVSAMKKAEISLRGALIDVLRDRRAVKAAPALLTEVEHPDAGIRERATWALRDLADLDNVGELISLLLETDKGADRDEIEKTIMFVCNHISEAEKQAGPVLAVMARSSERERYVLLPLLGRIGGPEALKEVQKAIGSRRAELHEARVRALCNWPEASVADGLLELAQQSADQTHKIWALRAYIRVVTLPTDPPRYTETLAKLKRAMAMAGRSEEKKLVVSRAHSARHVDTLRWLVPFLEDPALSAQACQAVVELAHHRELRDANQAEFQKALKKVVSVAKDPGLIERAKRYMAGL